MFEHRLTFLQKVSGGMDKKSFGFYELTRVAAAYRLECARRIRNNLLFTEKEISSFRDRFRRHEQQKSGTVPADVVGVLLDEISNNSRLVKAQHREAGLPEASTIDFGQFLKLVRSHLDQIERHSLAREQEAVKDTNFQSAEVQEFRKVFHTFDTRKNGEILFADLARLIYSILPADAVEDEKEFATDLAQIVCAVTGSGNRAYKLDLADFLRIMHKLQELNWRKINSASAGIAARERRKSSKGTSIDWQK